MIVEVEHPVAGKMKVAGNPIIMSLTPGAVEQPAPLLGQHSEEVMKEVLGFSDSMIEEYLKK
jgi:CoA:oxalate CoA-transferase